MIIKCIIFITIFLLGEIITNKTLFSYLKKYFKINDETDNKWIFFLDISTFKGFLERFVLFFALALNIIQILIVFGAIKIGTRFDKNVKVMNDYFIIGNFCSILTSIIYLVAFYYFYSKKIYLFKLSI